MKKPNAAVKAKTTPRHKRYDEFRESLAAPMPNSSYRSKIDRIDDEPSSLEQTLRTVAGFLILLLAVRFFIDLYSLNRFGAWASFFYLLTNWAVSPFLGIFGQSQVIAATGFVDWAALVSIAVTATIAWIMIRLIRPRPE